MENDMINFINKTPNAYICIKNIKEILLKNNLSETVRAEEISLEIFIEIANNI